MSSSELLKSQEPPSATIPPKDELPPDFPPAVVTDVLEAPFPPSPTTTLNMEPLTTSSSKKAKPPLFPPIHDRELFRLTEAPLAPPPIINAMICEIPSGTVNS